MDRVKNELWRLREWQTKVELEIKNKDNAINSLQNDVITYKNLISNLQKENRSNSKSNNVDSETKARILEDIKTMQEMTKTYSAHLQETDAQIRDFVKVLEEVKQDTTKRKLELNTFYENALVTLSTHHQELDAELKKQNAIIEDLQQQIQYLEIQLINERKENEALKQTIELKDNSIKRISTEVNGFILDIFKVIGSNEEHQLSILAKLNDLEIKASKLTQLVKHKNNLIRQLTESLDAAVEEKVIRIEELKSTNMEKSKIIADMCDLIKEKNMEVKTLNENLEKIQSEQRQVENTLNQLIRDKDVLKLELSHKEKESETLSKENTKLISNITDLNAKLKDKELALNELSALLKDKNMELQNLSVSLNDSSSKLDNLYASLEDKDIQISNKSDLIQVLLSEKTEMENMLGDLNIKLETSERDFVKACDDLTNLKLKISALETKDAKTSTILNNVKIKLSDDFIKRNESFKEAYQNDMRELNEIMCYAQNKAYTLADSKDNIINCLTEQVKLLESTKNELESELQRFKLNESNKMEKLQTDMRKLHGKTIQVASLNAEEVAQNSKDLNFLESHLCVKLSEFHPPANSSDDRSSIVFLDEVKENYHPLAKKMKRSETSSNKSSRKRLTKKNDLDKKDKTAHIRKHLSTLSTNVMPLSEQKLDEWNDTMEEVESSAEKRYPRDLLEELGI